MEGKVQPVGGREPGPGRQQSREQRNSKPVPKGLPLPAAATREAALKQGRSPGDQAASAGGSWPQRTQLIRLDLEAVKGIHPWHANFSLPLEKEVGSQRRGALKVCCQRASLERKAGTPPWRPHLAPFLVESQAHTPTCPNGGGGQSKGSQKCSSSSRVFKGPGRSVCVQGCVCVCTPMCLQLQVMVYLFIERMAGNIWRAGVRLCRKNTQQYDAHRREICGQFCEV